MENKINVVSIVGPTASGKTRLSIELAKTFDAEIISADSMQIYKNMHIATAKPTADEMCGIKHHLIDFIPENESYSVAMFVNDASECIKEIKSRGKIPFIVGGTGLYVDSLLNNVKFSEEVRDDKITRELWEIYESQGIDKLFDILSQFDIESVNRLKEGKNPKRIIRAIEYYRTTGRTITRQIEESRLTENPYRAIKIGLNFIDRQILYKRIDNRVDEMLKNGLIEEAQNVIKSNLSETSVKAIGYKELMPYLNGVSPLAPCVDKLKRETRRYAKRQITWFKRDKDINWLYVDTYASFDSLYYEAVKIIEEGLVLNG